MPEDKNQGKLGEVELLKKLERLETDIQEIERARHQQAVVTRVGLLLILLAILLFAWNLWQFSKIVTSDDYVAGLGESVQKHILHMVDNDENLKALRADITEKIIPSVSKQVMERVSKELPVFKQKGEKILENIKAHLEDTVKTKLAEEIDGAVKELEAEILKEYPDVSAEKLEAVFKKTEGVFLENITGMLEKKVELVYEDLDEMEKTLQKFSKIAEEAKLGEKELDMVKLDFLENLLELAIYHVNPDKGELPAEFVQRSDKAKPLIDKLKSQKKINKPAKKAVAPVNKEGGVK